MTTQLKQAEEAGLALSSASHCVDAAYRQALRDVLGDIEAENRQCETASCWRLTAKIKARLEKA